MEATSAETYEPPEFLEDEVKSQYVRWLNRKTNALVRRDRRRWKQDITWSGYKKAVHNAAVRSKGLDAYTGERLDWSLISQYKNSEARRLGSEYKRRMALLPTVDHADPESRQPDFRICGWRTNDWKSDLTVEGLVDMCERFLRAQITSSDPGCRERAERTLAKLCEDLARSTTARNPKH